MNTNDDWGPWPPRSDEIPADANGMTPPGYAEALLEYWDERDAIASEEPAPPPAIPFKLPDGWPAPLGEQAFHGILGKIIRRIEPHTEADPSAILIQLLVGTGNAIGRGPHFSVEATKHYPNEYTVIVGQSSRGRKGTGYKQVHRVLKEVAKDWTQSRIQSGLSSGEGLIAAIRDDVEETRPVYEAEKYIGRKTQIVQSGVEDKRLLVVEGEFGGSLKTAARDGNILSSVMRQLWDSGTVRTLTKLNPLKSTDAHVSIIGHITPDELNRYIAKTDLSNGFGNRFLWWCSRKSKSLGDFDKTLPEFGDELFQLRVSIDTARSFSEMRPSADANRLWKKHYERLSSGKPGPQGSLTDRAEAHVIRLALIYALLDRSNVITVEHLTAALEIWRYAEDSVKYIFSSTTGNPVADRILRSLQEAPTGLNRLQIHKLLGRHKSAEEITRALVLLQEYELVYAMLIPTLGDKGGRPAETWFLKGGLANEANEANEIVVK